MVSSWKKFTLQTTIACTPFGRKPRLYLRTLTGAAKHNTIISYLKQLRRHIGGKLYLLWDGLPAHRSKAVKAHLKTQRHWLKVYRFPAYAPELNPPEYLFSSIKTKDLSNLPALGMSNLCKRIKGAGRRLARKPDILCGFLRASKLY